MTRHHDKHRDMARSVLPSTNRRPARRALARAKRANRRAIKQDLHAITPRVSPLDHDFVEWDDHRDLRRYPDTEIASTVRRRRGGDKVNPFIRWAIATTADIPIDDRLGRLRANLPDGLVGDHALSHLERVPQLRPRREQDRHYSRIGRATRQAERSNQTARDLVLLAGLLHDVLVDGDLEHLNRFMKHCDHHATHQGCIKSACVKRCLNGLHDIDQFLVDIASAPTHRVPCGRAPGSLPARRFRAYLDQLRSATEYEPRPRPLGAGRQRGRQIRV
jgi:hypothetical protein